MTDLDMLQLNHVAVRDRLPRPEPLRFLVREHLVLEGLQAADRRARCVSEGGEWPGR